MKKVCAVLDKKAETYGMPIIMEAVGLATRAFVDACANPESSLNRHSEDYSLWHIADYDPNSGQFVNVPSPVFLISALSAVAQASKLGAPRSEPSVEVLGQVHESVS